MTLEVWATGSPGRWLAGHCPVLCPVAWRELCGDLGPCPVPCGLVVYCGCDRGIAALSHRGQGRGDSGRSVQRTHHSQLACSPGIPQPHPGELAVASAISAEGGGAGSWGGDR